MMSLLRTFWRQINEPPLKSDRPQAVRGAIGRVFGRFFLRPHWKSVLLIIVLAAVCGGLSKFFYAWTTRFIADDVVQVQLLMRDRPAAGNLDPTLPSENRLFALDESRKRTSWSQRLDCSSGRSLEEKFRLVALLAVMLLGVLAAEHLLILALNRRIIHVGQKVQFYLRHKLYQKLHSLPMSYNDEHAVGSQMTHLFSDVAGIQQFTVYILQVLPKYLVIMVAGLWIMFRIDPLLAGMVLLALPAYGVSYTWFHGRQRTVHQNLREREGRLNAHIANRIKNFFLVKSFVRETFETLDFLRRARPIIRETMTSAVLGSLFSIVCGIITGLCMVAVLWLGALRVRDGRMTLGNLLLFYSSAGFMFSPVAGIPALAGMAHRLRALCAKVIRVLDEPIALNEPAEGLPVPTSAPRVVFHNVTMRYDNDRPAAIKELSFCLPAGKTLCVMGPSGSGKTTLAKLVARIYDPTDGTVELAGTDIRRFRISHLRKMTGFLNQEPVIFDGTINDNIRYGSQTSGPREIVTAARDAQIHDYIHQLPQQYDTLTRERGLTLSGGQKQRVNLARVLLYDPKLLVLDDCTSALDAETEARLINAFDSVLRERTVILVSHRVSLAVMCDFVMVLDKGEMTEFGNPETLLGHDGPFRQLFEQQTNKSHVLRMDGNNS